MAFNKCVGFFDRQGLPTNKTYLTWNNAAYNSVLGGFVAPGANAVPGSEGIGWAELQTAAGAPAGSGAISGAAIDHAFDQVDAYNNTNPTQNWTVKMRVSGGEQAPTWAQNLGVGPITSDTAPLGSGLCSAWWDATYIAAWQQFMLKLAAYVPSYTIRSITSSGGLAVGANTQKLDGHPLLGEIVEAACMTLYTEPCLKDDYRNSPGGRANATAAGMTDNAEFDSTLITGTQITAMAEMHVAFPNTPWAFSYNPFRKTQTNTTDEARTELLVDYQVGASLSPPVLAGGVGNSGTPFPKAVMANNSLRANGLVYPPPNGPGPYKDSHDSTPGNYTSMYTKFASYSGGQATTDLNQNEPIQELPLAIQTSTLSGMTTPPTTQHDALQNTINYAIWLGARMVEVPSGYSVIGLTGSDLTFWQNSIASLLANDPPAAGTGTSPFRRRHWHTFVHK